MSVWSFASEYNFTGKTVIPFYTHNGSSSGTSALSTLTNLLPNSDVKSSSALSVIGSKASNSKDDVIKWLNQLGL